MHALNHLLSKRSSHSLSFIIRDFIWTSSTSTLSWPLSAILFVAIFLPLISLVQGAADLRLPTPVPPKAMEENEMNPPPPQPVTWWIQEVNPVSIKKILLWKMEIDWRQRKTTFASAPASARSPLILPSPKRRPPNGSLKKPNENRSL